MRSTRSRSVLVLMVLSVAVLGLSAWSLWRETRSYLAYPFPTDAERLERALDPEVIASFSLESVKTPLDDCAWAMTSLYGTLRPTPQRQTVAEACAAKAQEIVASRPASAYAVLVGGIAADVLGDAAGVNAALAASQRLAPTTEWLARARVALAARRQDSLSDDARAAERADIAIMASSASGLDVLATRYVRDAAFREKVIDIVGTLAAGVQGRFLDKVSQMSTQPGRAAP